MNKLILVLAASIACASAPAVAETSASVALGSDYVSRGTSQTFGDPAVMLYVEETLDSGFYIAGFVANVDFDNADVEAVFGDDGTFLETDLFAGYRGTISEKVSYDAGFAVIAYQGTKPTPGYNPSGNWNMVEAKLAVTYADGPLSLTGTVAATPDYFNNYGKSIWTEAAASYAVAKNLSVGAAIGRQSFFEESETGFPAELSNYNTWNVGATYSLTPSLSIDARYYDNDTKIDLGPIYEPRAVITLRKGF